MPLSRPITAGIAVSIVLVLLGLLLFLQTKDVLALVMINSLVTTAWVVALVIHVLTRGIPLRIIHDPPR